MLSCHTTSASNTSTVGRWRWSAVGQRDTNYRVLSPTPAGSSGESSAQNDAGPGRHVAVYLDDLITMEVGVELDALFGGLGEVIGSSTPSGTVAATTHFGPYSRLHEAHEAIRRWCLDNGHALVGPNWELYGHWEGAWDDDPSKITTDVFYLLDTGGNSAA